MPPTYTYYCEQCHHVTDAHYRLTETRPDTTECENCQGQAEYKLAAPMNLRASYLDGQRGKQWKQLREASKLNVAAARTDDQTTKSEMKKEINKMGYRLDK